MFPAFISAWVLWFALFGPLAITAYIVCKTKFRPEILFAALRWPCRSWVAGLTEIGFYSNAIIIGILGLYILTNMSQTIAFWQAFYLWALWTLLDIHSVWVFSCVDEWVKRECLSYTPLVNQTLKFIVTLAFAGFMMNNVIPQIVPFLGFIVVWSFWTWLVVVLVIFERWNCQQKRHH